jgi:hypothetical protein
LILPNPVAGEVDSIMKTWRNFGVIMVDDGPAENTREQEIRVTGSPHKKRHRLSLGR